MHLKHLNQETYKGILSEIYSIGSSLNGLGALLEQASNQSHFEHDELHGIGELAKVLSKSLSRVEDILRCGYDSITEEQKKNILLNDESNEPED